MLERAFVASAIGDAGSGHELVDGSAAIGDDQWNAARPRLRRGQAKGLGIATVNERIGTRQETREVVTIVDAGQNRHVRMLLADHLQLLARRSEL